MIILMKYSKRVYDCHKHHCGKICKHFLQHKLRKKQMLNSQSEHHLMKIPMFTVYIKLCVPHLQYRDIRGAWLQTRHHRPEVVFMQFTLTLVLTLTPKF